MKTLIVPCGGKSSRFKNMRPKYLLTHPDGEIMVKKAISGIDLQSFDRIIITIVKEHCEKYESDIILKQAFNLNKDSKIELCILPNFTKSQSETVFETIKMMKIQGQIAVKDSDNYIKIENIPDGNYIVGLDIEKFNKEIRRLGSKSFLIVNNQQIITDIIEKKIKSEHICLGMYGFSDANNFLEAYEQVSTEQIDARLHEIYLSHVISYMIGSNKGVFRYIETTEFEDWGTIEDWQIVQKSMRTYFIDLDGVIFKNRGKYGSKNWNNDNEPIEDNVELFKQLYDEGAQIVVTTSRGKEYEESIRAFFASRGIKIHAIVCGCNHAGRIIINDFAASNAYPSCQAISIPRNAILKDYFNNLDFP